MKKLLFTLFIAVVINFKGIALMPDEGMWLPMFIERLNYVDMQKMGLHLTAEELYSINNSSMKDAIVSLGFFCTAEVVSNEGLLFTNHHCGYDAIQSHSTLEHDYLTDGFWAMSKKEELSNKDLTASFLVRMEDVTSKVLAGLKDDMTESERNAKIEEISGKIEKEASEKKKYEANVKSFFDGNEFYLFVYQTYKDVRLVGAPPSAIGKFGGDTDNWMWPRQTGDFSIFRIYTAPDGSPAEYSEKNIPLKPKYSLPISLKGVKKDDFAMVWGYPGQTDRFLTSQGVKLVIDETNPTVVNIRDKKLSIIKEYMDASPLVKIQYSSKYYESSNYWKYFIGQTKGLKNLNVFEKKKLQEEAFTKWVNEDTKRKEKYGTALSYIDSGYNELRTYNKPLKYMEEVGFQGPEAIVFSIGSFGLYGSLKNPTGKEEVIKAQVEEFKEKAKEFFKNYNKSCDQKLFAEMMKMYYENTPKDQQPSFFKDFLEKKYKGDFNKFSEAVYSKSIFADSSKLYAFLAKPSFKVIDKDFSFIIINSIIKTYYKNSAAINEIQDKINKGNRLYVAGLKEMYSNKKIAPNANSTMRMSYGKVDDYFPADAVHYDYATTLDGIIQKEDSTVEDFIVPKKLHALWKKKDYGRYANADGNLNICFIANLDITGGNSGSPVINGDGQLIGIAFDGNWEAMSGDIAYEPDLQRTICVDIRYVLFVIDKYAGATNLINELTIVK
ncbi:MAG: S46 family peptidase [Bacteroidetes bacterium]|nr:S46 family peptidase [Bacteroidota bacterium]